MKLLVIEPVLAVLLVKFTSPLAETEAKVATPAPVTFQSLSCNIRFEPLEAPTVIVPPALLPMVVLAVPDVLTVVVPVREVVPEVTVKLLPEATVVLPLSVTPPLPL